MRLKTLLISSWLLLATTAAYAINASNSPKLSVNNQNPSITNNPSAANNPSSTNNPSTANNPSSTNDEEISEFEQLEETIGEIHEKIGSRAIVNAFDAVKLNMGGFIDVAFTHVNAKNNSVNSFMRQKFELLVSAELAEKWTSFFAGGLIRESDDPFGIYGVSGGTRFDPKFNSVSKSPHIIGWANYRYSDTFNLRMGRIITPHGIINIEHFPGTLLEPEQPQFLRPFSGDTLFPNFLTGAELHGKINTNFFAKDYLDYSIYYANFTGEPQKAVSGARLACNIKYFSLGLNFLHGKRSGASFDYSTMGIDFKIEAGNFLWKSEYFKSNEKSAGDRKGYYVQPAYYLTDKWVIFYRFDFVDTGGTATAGRIENVFGFNYIPYPNIRLRANYTVKHFNQNRDASSNSATAKLIQLSATYSF